MEVQIRHLDDVGDESRHVKEDNPETKEVMIAKLLSFNPEAIHQESLMWILRLDGFTMNATNASNLMVKNSIVLSMDNRHQINENEVGTSTQLPILAQQAHEVTEEGHEQTSASLSTKDVLEDVFPKESLAKKSRGQVKD
ncbi:hypothetical protein PTKIN_Ptkin14bG0058800 [Pterospermum kingtungense]